MPVKQGRQTIYRMREQAWEVAAAILFSCYCLILADPQSGIGHIRHQCILTLQACFANIGAIVGQVLSFLLAPILRLYHQLTSSRPLISAVEIINQAFAQLATGTTWAESKDFACSVKIECTEELIEIFGSYASLFYSLANSSLIQLGWWYVSGCASFSETTLTQPALRLAWNAASHIPGFPWTWTADDFAWGDSKAIALGGLCWSLPWIYLRFRPRFFIISLGLSIPLLLFIDTRSNFCISVSCPVFSVHRSLHLDSSADLLISLPGEQR